MKKFFIFMVFLFCSAVAGYFYIERQALKLKSTFPVFDFTKKSYRLVTEKPRGWISVDKVSNQALWAIVLSEDWAFYQHFGLDINQLYIVIEESLKAQKFVRGASTITQQVVKNTLLTNQRSLWRKIKEIPLSLMLETKLSKKEILEIYINLIELGPNLYGLQNASFFYFKKHPSQLSAKEGAFLAMLLPSPKRYSQSYRQKKLTPFAKDQVQDILVKLKMTKKISEEEFLKESEAPLSFEEQPLI